MTFNKLDAHGDEVVVNNELAKLIEMNLITKEDVLRVLLMPRMEQSEDYDYYDMGD